MQIVRVSVLLNAGTVGKGMLLCKLVWSKPKNKKLIWRNLNPGAFSIISMTYLCLEKTSVGCTHAALKTSA